MVMLTRPGITLIPYYDLGNADSFAGNLKPTLKCHRMGRSYSNAMVMSMRFSDALKVWEPSKRITAIAPDEPTIAMRNGHSDGNPISEAQESHQGILQQKAVFLLTGFKFHVPFGGCRTWSYC